MRSFFMYLVVVKSASRAQILFNATEMLCAIYLSECGGVKNKKYKQRTTSTEMRAFFLYFYAVWLKCFGDTNLGLEGTCIENSYTAS